MRNSAKEKGMDFFELLIKRRTIRDFEDKDVPRELVEQMIEDGTKAPNGGNRQPWNFIIVHSKAWIKKISDASKRDLLAAIAKNPDHPLKQYEAGLGNEKFNVFYNAPCLVLVTGLPEAGSLVEDCSLFAAYFMLSATARGLGTCWVALGGGVQDPELLREIGLPEGQRIVAPIIVGYPKRIPVMPARKKPNILKVIS
jgi:nitroreductase